MTLQTRSAEAINFKQSVLARNQGPAGELKGDNAPKYTEAHLADADPAAKASEGLLKEGGDSQQDE